MRVLEDGVELERNWKERGDKVVIVIVVGALELERVGGRGMFEKRIKWKDIYFNVM